MAEVTGGDGGAGPGRAIDAIRAIAAEHELDPEFPPAVVEETRALLAAPGIDDPALADLTALPFVTIDDATSRDLDQAVFVSPRGDGGARVFYALADASHYVTVGSALFDEALRRGASYYLPGTMVPMLPRALSEGIISLNEGQDRRALVMRMDVAPDGRRVDTTILRARIRSRRKLSFEGVQRFLDADEGLGDPEIEASMLALREVGELRMKDASERDVVRYRRTEVVVKLDGDAGSTFVAFGDLRNDVDRYNEQMSLLCNIEGARFLSEGDTGSDRIDPIYRVHPPPPAERFDDLADHLAELSRAHGLPADRWAWRPGRASLGDFLEGLPRKGREGRIARAVHRQAVLINGRSVFSERPGAHFGVGAEVYARFSAPMREVVGVFVHREAIQKLSGAAQDDAELRARVVDAANAAKWRQKQLDDRANLLVLDQIFREAPDRVWDATVMGVTGGKVHLTLAEPPIDVKLYTRHLAQQLGAELEPSRHGARLLRRGAAEPVCRVGDAVRVRVEGRDRKGRFVLRLVR